MVHLRLDYILRGVTFVLHTDHRNLTYLSSNGSPKVIRWKLDIQEYSMALTYIKGEHNRPADELSRLCPLGEEAVTPLTIANLIETERIPDKFYNIIRRWHNTARGHFGVEQTLARIRADQSLPDGDRRWPYQREHVKRFIRLCPPCQKMSYLKPVIETLPFTLATYARGERSYVDTIGPLTPTAEGYQFILVVIEAFTRYVDLVALRSTDAAGAVDALNQIFARSGVPQSLVSDKGTQFVNELMTAYCQMAGIHQRTTTANSKEENGLVERANKEVMRHLRAFVFDHRIQNEWHRYLPFVMRILNTKRHDITRQSPVSLTYLDGQSMEKSLLDT